MKQFLLIMEPLKKMLVGLTMVVVVLLGVPVFADSDIHPEKIFEMATAVSARVFGGGIQCTAGYIGHSATTSIVLSAGHCADGGINGIEDHTLKGVSVNYGLVCEKWSVAFGYDAAICYTDHLNSKDAYANQIRQGPLNPGEIIITVGYGEGTLTNSTGSFLGYGVLVQTGTDEFGYPVFVVVEAKYGDPGSFALFQMQVPIKHGQSGSLVFDTEGRIVGILVYGLSGEGGIFGEVGGVTTVDNMLEVLN